MKSIARHRARECVVQAIYAWQISQNNIEDIELQVFNENNMEDVDINYFRILLQGVFKEASRLDSMMEPVLSRKLTELGPVEHAILRLALFELSHCKSVPYKVVINEGVELAKNFGAQESYKFINGVLDKVVPFLRKQELIGIRK